MSHKSDIKYGVPAKIQGRLYPPPFTAHVWQVAPTLRSRTDRGTNGRAGIHRPGGCTCACTNTPSKRDTVESTRAEGVLLHVRFLRSHTSLQRQMQLIYPTEISSFFSIIPQQIDASRPSLLRSQNSIAVKILALEMDI